MVPVELASVGVTHEGGDIVMVLRAPTLARLLVMVIGPLEGRALFYSAEGVKPPRPLTHDLIMNVLEATGYKLERVEIRDMRDGAYIAALILNRRGQIVEVDARPSDSVALALLAKVPILAREELVQEAGIAEEGEEPKPLH